ncbi:hypothetical protein KC727_00340 [Candidatus Kaiserbacteria bacterium]|nr:hypothetical protein [Candidatus Kaiserbacteria bacterium]
MINFLPPEGLSLVKREYWVRVLSVWGFLLFAVCVVSVLSLLPTYVLLKSQLAAAEVRIVGGEDTTEEYRVAAEAVKDANVVIGQLEKTRPSVRPSEIVGALVAATPANVEVNRLLLKQDAGAAVSAVQVQGVAATREALVRFKEVIQEGVLFSEVEVPISDLAREVELPFAIMVTLNPLLKQ